MNPYYMSYMAGRMPFSTFPDYTLDFMGNADQEQERDRMRMRELYPDTAKRILPFIEEACDKMEYEGSIMFDEAPDRLMLRKMCREIYDQVRPLMEVEEVMEPEGVDIFTMQYGGERRRRGNDRDWLNDFIEILLFDEMHRRRNRRRDRRRGRFY